MALVDKPPIANVLSWLSDEHEFVLSNSRTLELFGRDGTWQTKYFANFSRYSEVWEIDYKYERDLKLNLPRSNIVMCDSIKAAAESKANFDFIVSDNPQNIYGRKGEYCEHFELVEHIGNLFQSSCWLLLNVNHTPFNSIASPNWMQRRQEFYKTSDVESLQSEFIVDFYKNYFGARNICCSHIREFIRDPSYLSYYLLFLEK